ncbi:endonuclease/exonuclease/phosphatase family protein [Shewanella sp. H8]|uniref:endonuclease/exonuclease/phosphatase family protein n=1 Tax=Shewanella sp. H8 TaxID=3342676 RepID=UPI0033155DC0
MGLAQWGSLIIVIFIMAIVVVVPMFVHFSTEPQVINSEQQQFVAQCVDATSDTKLDIDGQLAVASWNIYKQQNDGWQTQLSQLAKQNQLMLLQEVKLSDTFQQWRQQNHQQLAMVQAFRQGDIPLGVMNLSQVTASQSCGYLTSEPFIQFPKSSLLSYFPLSNGETLLVANLHSINFEYALDSYAEQLQQVLPALKAHKGPIIFGGDLNTWRQARLSMLAQMTKTLGLKAVTPNDDTRTTVMGYAIDHLFYRGLTLESARVINTQTSDHHPLLAQFRLGES